MKGDDQDFEQGWKIEDLLYKKIYDEAVPLLRPRQNDIHARICYHFALKLLQQEGGEPGIVLPAVLLHDVGYSSIPEEELRYSFGPHIEKPELRLLHEKEGARLAGEILHEFNYPASRIREIQHIIDGHDTRETPLGLNDKIVKDSDKLWRFSHEGLIIDAERFDLSPRDWLNYITERISTWLYTGTAKQLAFIEARRRQNELQEDNLREGKANQ